MSDIVDSLNRIANILQSSLESDVLQPTVGQLSPLFVGALLGAIVTYLWSRKLQQELFKQNKKEEEEKRAEGRELLSNLLEYEITRRWKNKIGKYFKKHLEELNDKNLDKIFNATFRTHDLHIIKQCAEDVFAANLFDDNAVISDIVRVHGFSIDLADGKEGLRERFTKYQEAIRALESAHDDNADIESLKRKRDDAKKHLDHTWKFLKTAYEGIDEHMNKILTSIKKDC